MIRLTRATIWIPLALLALTGSTRPAAADQTFGNTSLKPQLWETARPALEEEAGTNQYWHDPFLGNWEMCRAWAPASNGCPPSWYSRAEFLALTRSPEYSYPFASLGPGGPIVLSTSDFESDFDGGLRILLGKSLGSWYRLEASYFGSYTWTSLAAVRNDDANALGGQGNLFSPFSRFGDAPGIPGLDYNSLASIAFESQLNNGELNLRRRLLMVPGCYETSFLIGARYLEINEQFAYHTLTQIPGAPSRTADVDISTDNQLIGAQIGLLGQFLVQPRLWIDFQMKGGVYQNRTGLTRAFTVGEFDGQSARIVGTDAIDRTSFVGDLSLQVNYQFSPSWTFYAGYNVMWVTGLALGPENFTTNLSELAVGPTLINHDGQLVYHGPNFGLTFSW